eukprot:3347200-Prymnesium_polylepis.1
MLARFGTLGGAFCKRRRRARALDVQASPRDLLSPAAGAAQCSPRPPPPSRLRGGRRHAGRRVHFDDTRRDDAGRGAWGEEI